MLLSLIENSDSLKFVVFSEYKGQKLLISKKSRSDVQHHNHTQIIQVVIVGLKVVKLFVKTCVPSSSLLRQNYKF